MRIRANRELKSPSAFHVLSLNPFSHHYIPYVSLPSLRRQADRRPRDSPTEPELTRRCGAGIMSAPFFKLKAETPKGTYDFAVRPLRPPIAVVVIDLSIP